jgi:hypothetical protein
MASETARIRVRGCSVAIEHPGGQLRGDAVDVSLTGVGLVLSEALAPNTEVSIHLVTESGTYHPNGRVRYCRARNREKKSFRVGLVFDSLGRIDTARWRGFVELQTAGLAA